MADKSAGGDIDIADFKDGITVSSSYPALPVIDYDYYLTFLEESDAPIEKKYELIDILLNIMMGFADIAFGLSPTQNVCGQLPKIDPDSHIPANGVVKLEDHTARKEFSSAAKGGRE